ncbi:MAG: hypothetical protein C0490_07230 [Marivirga sp.]|nr:hypothetical protein [Marivirga sp.]
MLKSIYLTLFFVVVLVSSEAQNEFYKLTALPLNDLSAFKTPAKNWKIMGQVSGSYENTVSKSEKGSGILFNDFDPKAQFNATTNLFTQLEHGDIFLALDFMIPKGSNSGIYLQGRYEIQLFDSWSVKVPHVTDCGSIYERWDEKRPEGKKGYEGHPARTNASLAPNLWQHLEIEFRAPRFDSQGKKVSSAQFVKVRLNGIVIHENVILGGPTRAAAFTDEKATGPLMIQGDHGPVVFRNIQYALLDEFKVAFKTLDYAYYEGNFNDFPKVEASHLIRKGKAEAIDIKLADNPNKLCLIFTGKLDLKESTEYQFIIKKIGKAKLSIDGEEVIRTNDLFQDFTISKNLNAGEHTIVFSYLKDFSWAPTGMGLYIGKLNSRPQALHTASSLPPLPPTPLIDVNPAQHPEIVRSFMEHLGKKKTHVISVGDPAGVHYAYDLNQAGVLQVWKGGFLNATDMWYERGEPQVATSMGAAIVLSGKPPIALVADNKVALPDSLNDKTDLLYKGYTLNAQRSPTFSYAYKEISFEDSFVSLNNGQGLARSISIPKMPPASTLFIRMGEGSVITEVAENIFAIDDQRYYIQFYPIGKLKPQIRTIGDKKELVVEVKTPFPAVIKYNLLW